MENRNEDKLELIAAVSTLPAIDFNFEDLKAQAQNMADTYTSIAVTEDTYMAAKRDAKELAGMAAAIDKKRKDVKKVLEVPIKDFESKCKELQSILLEAKGVIEGQTEMFDEKRRNDKITKANEYIARACAEAGLTKEYAASVVVKPDYSSLSGTFKSVKADIDAQVSEALQKQERDAKIAQAINLVTASAKGALEGVNSGLEQKLDIAGFAGRIRDLVMDSDLEDISSISAAINSEIIAAGSKIKEAEENIRRQAEENIRKKLEGERTDAPALAPAHIPIPEQETDFTVPDIQDEPAVPETEPVIQPIPELPRNEPSWHMAFGIEGPRSALAAVGEMIKKACEENGCTYTGAIKDMCYLM